MDLALDNLQRLICRKTQTTSQPTNYKLYIYIYIYRERERDRDRENLTLKIPQGVDTIYPTPPLGQDMTQGQFLSEV